MPETVPDTKTILLLKTDMRFTSITELKVNKMNINQVATQTVVFKKSTQSTMTV